MVQPTGSPAKLDFFAGSETSFFRATPNIEIEFARDGQGAVTHLIFRQAGRELKAMRK